VIPSAGADFGKLMDQAGDPSRPRLPDRDGAALRPPLERLGRGRPRSRRFADRIGRPIIAYVKGLGYIEPATLGALAKDG
jgi:hypothetical protein